MVISMNKKHSEAEKKLINDFKPIADSLREKGWSDKRIQSAIRKTLDTKSKKEYFDFNPLSDIGKDLIQDVRKKADSKIEAILYKYLCDANIDFEFQYRIGKYRVDFFIPDALIVEVDGPYHDKKSQIERDRKKDNYLKLLGYEVLRIPVLVLTYSPEAVIDEIKSRI